MVVLLAPFSVLRVLGASWALELNLLTLGMLGFSLAATYALAYRLVRRVDAAVFAAVAYTFSGFTYAHLGHLQLLLLGQFPLGVLLAFRWFERRRPLDALWFGLANASFFLGSLYYAAIWTVCRRGHRRRLPARTPIPARPPVLERARHRGRRERGRAPVRPAVLPAGPAT